MDSNVGGCAIRFVPVHTVDMNDPLLAVHLRDLALTTLVFSSNNANFIIFANWQ